MSWCWVGVERGGGVGRASFRHQIGSLVICELVTLTTATNFVFPICFECHQI